MQLREGGLALELCSVARARPLRGVDGPSVRRLEAAARAEVARQQEVEERPELYRVVLEWRTCRMPVAARSNWSNLSDQSERPEAIRGRSEAARSSWE